MVTYFFPKIHVAFCENVTSKLRMNKDLKQVGLSRASWFSDVFWPDLERILHLDELW